MFTTTSRYAGVEVAETTVPAPDVSERAVRYVRRRFLPRFDEQTRVGEHVVAPGERLDHIAARYVGDPTRFWLLCDANPVMRPAELEAEGRTILIAMPVR